MTTGLHYAFRTLFKTPFITGVAVVSLALGIGANAAIFSCFNQMLLEALPVPRPSELVNLSAPGPKPGSQSCGQAGDCDAVFSYAMFRDLQKAQTVFTGIALHLLTGANLSFNGETLNGLAMLVSGNYFQVLQVQPALGRLFDSNDDRLVGEAQVVVLSYDFWKSRFGADPNVLNKGLIVNGVTLTIVGVTPRGFEGTTLGAKPEVFAPITMRGVLFGGWRDVLRRHEDVAGHRVGPGPGVVTPARAVERRCVGERGVRPRSWTDDRDTRLAKH